MTENNGNSFSAKNQTHLPEVWEGEVEMLKRKENTLRDKKIITPPHDGAVEEVQHLGQ